jgi:predicted restriction endonuclease
MKFQRSQTTGPLRWHVKINSSETADISNGARGEIALDITETDSVQFPLTIRIEDTDFPFDENQQLENIILSDSDLPLTYTFEIPAGAGRPSIQIILNDSGGTSLTSTCDLAYSEPINLATAILTGRDNEELIETIESYYETNQIWDSRYLKRDIEYFVSFEEYVQILDFLHQENPKAGEWKRPRTLTKRVVKKNKPYSASSFTDLRKKVDLYSSAENLCNLSVEEVVIEQVYDVFADSSNEDFDSLIELSCRLDLDEQWHRILKDYNLDLILCAYYLFGDDDFGRVLEKQDSTEVQGFQSDNQLNHIAKTLHNTADHNQNRKPLSSELYKYAANINSQLGNEYKEKQEIARLNIGRGLQYHNQGDYEQAQIYFESASELISDNPNLRNSFLAAVRHEAESIKSQLDEDGDIDEANEKIKSLYDRVVNHPSAEVDREDEILEIKEDIKTKLEGVDQSDYSEFDEEGETPDKVTRDRVEQSQAKRDPNFGPKVKSAYQNKCAVCGSQRYAPDGRPEVEAAHIRSAVSDNGPDSIKNGVALCRLHHWGFDKGWFSINDDYSIIVRDEPEINGYDEFRELEGDKLNLPEDEELRPETRFLQFHREKHGFQGNPQ